MRGGGVLSSPVKRCDIDLRIPIIIEAKLRSILVFSGRYHIMPSAYIINIFYNLLKPKRTIPSDSRFLHLEQCGGMVGL